MAAAGSGGPSALTAKQSAGCFAVAALGLAGAALCVVLGIRCIATTSTFDCLGLVTVFPAAFAGVGLIAFAIGWRRYVKVEPRATGGAGRLGATAVWQPVERTPLDGVIPLPGRSESSEYEDTQGGGSPG